MYLHVLYIIWNYLKLPSETQWNSSVFFNNTKKITTLRIRLPAHTETNKSLQLEDDGH